MGKPIISDDDRKKYSYFFERELKWLEKDYSSKEGDIIYFLLEQYWERMFFCWIFYKAKMQYNLLDEISGEQNRLNAIFLDYFEKEKDNFSSLYLFNWSLYIWIDYIRLLSNDDSLQIEQIIQNIESFLSFYKKKTDANISTDDTYQMETIQDSICLVTSIALLLLKKQNTEDKAKKLAELLYDLNILFDEVEIDIENPNKSIDDTMNFLLERSNDIWKDRDFNSRYSMLSIIRIQLFLFSNEKENVSNEIVEKAKGILRSTEQIDNKNRLATLLHFSLYSMNNDLIKEGNHEYKSSFLFQSALDFTEKDEISNIQFEYLFFCILKCWYNRGEELQKILKCFVKCSGKYFDKIVEKISEYPNAYVYICNCLNSFKENERSLQIGNTGYTFISFFSEILKQAKLKEGAHWEDAECAWENYKFASLSDKEQQAEKQNFEEYWQKQKAENCLLGQALRFLFVLDANNVNNNTMCRAYNFLTTAIQKNTVLINNHILILACLFCNEKKHKNTFDEEYVHILDLIIDWESEWEHIHGEVEYGNSAFLYKTLCNHTDENEYYYDKYIYYNNLIKEE